MLSSRAKFFSIFLLFPLVAIGDAPPTVSKAELAARVEAIRHLAPYRKWQLVKAHPLSAGGAETGHPQGLIVQKSRVILSCQGKKAGALLNYEWKENSLTYISTRSFGELRPAKRHAGGIHLAADRQTILVPLAGTKSKGSTFVLAENLEEKSSKILLNLPFHLGTLLYEPTRQHLYAIDYTKNMYGYDLASSVPLGGPFAPSLTTEYQDCKSLGGDGYFLCAGKDKNGLGKIRGYLDLIHVKEDGTYSESEMVRIPVPHVAVTGTFGEEWGVYVPGWVGNPPLTYNAFDFEFLPGQSGVRFYFAPHDFPDTTLLVYDAEIQ